MAGLFLDGRRLTYGTWRAFELDVARLLLQNGFTDVQVVGGAGDQGADVLGIKNGQLWVIQCKFRRNRISGAHAVDEVVAAAHYYGADRLAIATSQPFSPAMEAAIRRWATLGVRIESLPRVILAAMAEHSPQYCPSRIDLYRYQRHCVSALRAALAATGRAQMVLATGLGKTVIMAETTADLWRENLIEHGRALVLSDKVELSSQLQRSFWQQLPKDVPTHRLAAGEAPAFWDGVTFATVQSAASHLAHLPKFGLVWVDEAHHVGAQMFRDVLAHVAAPLLGGATATPWRGDAFDINEIFGAPVVRIGIADGIRHGYLCDVDYRLMADDLDWTAVRRNSKNGYSFGNLNTKLLIPIRDAEAARMLAQTFRAENRRSMVVFCPSVTHARLFAATLRMFGLRVGSITSTLPGPARERVMRNFRRRQVDAVTTVDIFNEGVDVPDVDMLAFMRLTHSRRIFVQQLGRGLRVSPDKDRLVVMDFVSDLRRLADVVGLQRAAGRDVESLQNFQQMVRFRDQVATKFMYDWVLQQADFNQRENDASLLTPEFSFADDGFVED